MTTVRSIILAGCLGGPFLTGNWANAGAASAPSGRSFFDVVRQRAQALAKEDYRPPETKLPDDLKNLSYNAYQQIHARRDRALWHGEQSRFQVEFFHPGYLFREPVRIHVLEDGQVHDLHFSPDWFAYGTNRFPQPLSTNLFFVGLRLLYPVNRPDKMDQVAVFLGSSFFRLLGAHQVFGASARGLAIDTAEPSGEEFPQFTEFWIEKPGPTANFIRLFVLLESKRVTGAYEFVIQPGEATLARVGLSLFFRDSVTKLGLAPLTSMFFYGENRTRYFPDFRPEVHDSDGLQVETAQHRWLWRPLCNPPKVHQISSFPQPAAFGLLQRDRDFSHYQDLEAHFEARPSYWVAPEGAWPTGRVELVEIPTTEERNDNIVAYWVPEEKVDWHREFRFRYHLSAYRTNPDRPPADLLRVRSTRIEPREKTRERFLVDFAGAPSELDPRGTLAAQFETTKAKVENLVVEPNDMIGGWRTFFDLIPAGDEPVHAQFWLHDTNRVRSETWVDQFTKP